MHSSLPDPLPSPLSTVCTRTHASAHTQSLSVHLLGSVCLIVYLRNANFRLIGLSRSARVPASILGAVSGVSFLLMPTQKFTSSLNALVSNSFRSKLLMQHNLQIFFVFTELQTGIEEKQHHHEMCMLVQLLRVRKSRLYLKSLEACHV